MRTICLLASLTLLATLQACGGGSDDTPETAQTFQTRSVTVDRLSARADTYINATAEFKTFGPTLTAVTWRAIPKNNATGGLIFGDQACGNARKNSRAVPGTEKVSTLWQCDTSVLPETGTQGQFRLIAAAVDSDGNTAEDELLITITP